MKYTIYCDGICEPNPGKGAWAFVVFNDEDSEVVGKYDYMGDGQTNQTAEYMAVIEALVWCHEMVDDEFLILSDSQLVVNQLNGIWKVGDKMRRLFDNAMDLIEPHVRIAWVKGTENRADELTRVAYEKGTGLWPEPRKPGEGWRVNLVSRPIPNGVDYESLPF